MIYTMIYLLSLLADTDTHRDFPCNRVLYVHSQIFIGYLLCTRR